MKPDHPTRSGGIVIKGVSEIRVSMELIPLAVRTLFPLLSQLHYTWFLHVKKA
jgi:hypothetical protein